MHGLAAKQAFFAEAASNPATYMRIPGDTGGAPAMSAADAPFVDAAAEEEQVSVELRCMCESCEPSFVNLASRETAKE